MAYVSTPSRLGQVDATGDARALFLKVFAGEILTAYKNSTVTMDRHVVRTISSGKSAQFPASGIATAAYHTPGQSISDSANGYLSTIRHGERVINIDDLLIAATFIANIDEAMNHYDVRSIYSTELGTALALKMDGNVLRKFIGAARTNTGAFTGAGVGTVINAGATVATTGSVLAAQIYAAGIALDQKNVPAEGRFAFVRPAQYGLLAQTTNVINKDWNGAGSYSDGSVLRIAGIEIVKTNQIPSTDETGAAAAGDKNTYSLDYTNTVAVVAHKNAVGTVKLLDLAVESEYKIDLQGTLSVAKYACGHGVLRPECSVEITKA